MEDQPNGSIPLPKSYEQMWSNMLDVLIDQMKARALQKNDKGQINKYASRERSLAITALEEGQNWIIRLLVQGREEPLTGSGISIARHLPD